MTLLLPILVSSLLAVFSVSSLYSGVNEKGPLILQKVGNAISEKTWKLLTMIELNLIALSWFTFSFLDELPFNTTISSLQTTLNIFVGLSILSILVVLIRQGHIKAPYRTIESDSDLFEFELDSSEYSLDMLEDIITRIDSNPKISKASAKEFLVKLSLRDDELGVRSREYLASASWNK